MYVHLVLIRLKPGVTRLDPRVIAWEALLDELPKKVDGVVRWEHGWKVRPEPKKNITAQPKNIAGRYLYDTILHSAKTLEMMIALVGSDHVLLGSDYPYDMAMLDCVAHVRSLKISDADKAAILGGHAETLLSGKPA
jgi:hypothetical protein